MNRGKIKLVNNFQECRIYLSGPSGNATEYLATLYWLLKSLNRFQKSLILLGLDLVWIAVAVVAAQILVGGWLSNPAILLQTAWYLMILIPVGALLIAIFGLHRVKLSVYSMDDAIDTATLAVLLGSVGVVSGLFPFVEVSVSTQVFAIMSLAFLVLSVSGRIALRNLVLNVVRRNQNRKRVLIYGAGQTGQQLAAALTTDDEFESACFVDDNVALHGLNINGLRVFPPHDIPKLVARHEINRIVLAMPSASHSTRLRIAKSLSSVGCEVHALPSFAEMVLGGSSFKKVKPFQTLALLGRTALEGELPTSNEVYKGHSILVTGAGGSIGSELCRQLLLLKPRRLILFDHSELSLYTIERELAGLDTKTEIVSVLGTITEAGLVRETLEVNAVDVVFHAAAYKHLSLVEVNPLEGLRNNVFGTRILAEEARRAGVARFILVSTDKAVRPTSIMGSSKRMAELVIQDLATRSEQTRFSMVRFGNVMGSSGSVIPLFEEQIRIGGPVTVTHPDVTRYFMTTSEAVRLVLMAGTFSRGGDVFVLDMGQPVRILDVAWKMIEGSGYSVRDAQNPDGDIAIEFTSLRPGEKMQEELLIGSDMLTTPHPKILRAQENNLSEIEMANALQDLRRTIENRDLDGAKATLRKWVENYENPKECTHDAA